MDSVHSGNTTSYSFGFISDGKDIDDKRIFVSNNIVGHATVKAGLALSKSHSLVLSKSHSFLFQIRLLFESVVWGCVVVVVGVAVDYVADGVSDNGGADFAFCFWMVD
eukprot:m.91467 g.91467  ORF g.91467 m.91467 type:complete len:108 (+) comp26471_c2_seq1:2061-2384(+)